MRRTNFKRCLLLEMVFNPLALGSGRLGSVARQTLPARQPPRVRGDPGRACAVDPEGCAPLLAAEGVRVVILARCGLLILAAVGASKILYKKAAGAVFSRPVFCSLAPSKMRIVVKIVVNRHF